jgi:hypothetical protein
MHRLGAPVLQNSVKTRLWRSKALQGYMHEFRQIAIMPCARCLVERVSFSGSYRRCLIFSPLPCPTLQTILDCYVAFVFSECRPRVVQGAVPCL